MRRSQMIANYPYRACLTDINIYGKDLLAYSLSLNHILNVHFVPLSKEDSKKTASLSVDVEGEGFSTAADIIIGGFWVLPSEEALSGITTINSCSDEGKIFLIERDLFQRFLGEINALMLFTKPDDFGIEDIDGLDVVQFIRDNIIDKNLLSPYVMKYIVIDQD